MCKKRPIFLSLRLSVQIVPHENYISLECNITFVLSVLSIKKSTQSDPVALKSWIAAVKSQFSFLVISVFFWSKCDSASFNRVVLSSLQNSVLRSEHSRVSYKLKRHENSVKLKH